MVHRHQLEILDALITGAASSVEGFRSAASETSNTALRLQFTDRAEETEDVMLDLETRVRQLGGEPAFLPLRASTGRRPGRRYSVSLIELDRRGNDMVQQFERALASTGLDAETRATLSMGMATFRERPHEVAGEFGV